MRKRQPSDGGDRRLDATKAIATHKRSVVSFLSLSLLFVLTRSGSVAFVLGFSLHVRSDCSGSRLWVVRELGSRRVLWGQLTAARREHYLLFSSFVVRVKGLGICVRVFPREIAAVLETLVAGSMLVGCPRWWQQQQEHKPSGQCCIRGASALPSCMGLRITGRRLRVTPLVASSVPQSSSSSQIVCEAQETLTGSGGNFATLSLSPLSIFSGVQDFCNTRGEVFRIFPEHLPVPYRHAKPLWHFLVVARM